MFLGVHKNAVRFMLIALNKSGLVSFGGIADKSKNWDDLSAYDY